MTECGPSKRRYRVGILGAGYIADWHCRALRQIPCTETVAAADVSLSRAEQLAAQFGIERVYPSLEEMIKHAQLDCVHLLVPPSYHLETALSSLDAGVHVLLEKPMCVSSTACDTLVARARESGVSVGVNHNFLFFPTYERLRKDLRSGRIGKIDSLTIVWNKPLAQLQTGPFDTWMFEQPGNLILDTAPHSTSQLLDLLGQPEQITSQADDYVDLPRRRTCFRRWTVMAQYPRARAQLLFSYAPGFSEHYLHVRGTHGNITADFENQTYTLQRPSRYSMDVDRYVRTTLAGKQLKSQARSNLLRYVASKLGLNRDGNAYGTSIRRSLESFYEHIEKPQDPRLAVRFGRDVVHLCERMVDGAKLPSPPVAPRPSPTGTQSKGPSILVTGGTGFIGRELTRQLVQQGHVVRILTRHPGSMSDEWLIPEIDVIEGSLTNPEDLKRSLEGVSTVYHLARPQVNRWRDYLEQDVRPTRELAEQCLRQGIQRLLYTGSIDAYYAGSSAGVIREETGLDPSIEGRNDYARSKYEIEKLLLAMHRRQGLPVVIFRPGVVIGSGGSPFHWGVGMWSGESLCQLWGDGRNPLPFVLVEDVAAALVRSLEVPEIEGESFNLVGEPFLSAREYIAEVERYSGASVDVIPTPIWRYYLTDLTKWGVKMIVRHPERRLASYRDWKSRTQNARFDCTKAKTLLGWQPCVKREHVIERGIRVPVEERYGSGDLA